MSTRATYKIYCNANGMNVYFYIHSDNYPRGAAHHFSEMINFYKGTDYSYAAAFFRANGWAQFTMSHEQHADAQYRYTLDETGFLIVKRMPMDTVEAKWKHFFMGTVQQFIDQYGIKEEIAA